VTAAGTLPLTYQWQKGGSKIDGAVASSFVITNTQLADAGSYSVTISNALGFTNSSNAILTVNPPPPCVPPPSGLLGWWPGNGDATDIAGPNNGLFTGALFGPGKVGQAFELAGTDNVRIPASPILDVGSGPGFTIEAWINPGTLSGGRPIFEWAVPNAYGVHFWINAASAGDLYANIADTSGNNHTIMTPGGTVAANQFQHVAVTYDRTSGVAQLLVNGVVLQQSILGSFTPQTSSDAYIGYRPSTSPNGPINFTGFIDEVSLYNHALSTGEVQAIYQAGSAGKCSAPSPPFVFSQPTDQTVYVGGTAMFSVTAAGTLPLTYQWQKGGSKIDGALTSSFVITNAQLADAGSYSVIISNALGFTTSSNASLTVNPAPPCVPPPSGLVGWWPGNGDATDIIGPDDGLFSGASFGPGEVGQAFQLADTNNVRIPASPILDVGSGPGFTIEAWINPGTLTWGRPILEWAVPNAYGVHFWINAANAGDLYANIADTSGNNRTIQTPGGTVAANQYQHVAVTYDRTSGVAQLFVDGVVVQQSILGSFTPQTSSDAYIGYRPSTSPYGPLNFTGLIDEVSLYNRALSTGEIFAVYSALSSGKCMVPAPPRIFSQPTDQTIYTAQTATFSVLVLGSRPLTYQWMFNGKQIDGATTNPLVLSNTQFKGAGNYSVTVSNSAGSITSSNAALTVAFPPASVQLASLAGTGGGTIVVPLSLVANGNENTLGCSLNFDTHKLTYLDATPGNGASSATLLVNTNATANGQLGLLVGLPAASAFPPGTQELVQITFALAVVTDPTSAAITFADSPVLRQLSDTNASILAVNYTGGTVTISATPFEGDVSPRPSGDEALTATDWVLEGRYVARLDYPTNSSEFQRADCAPRSTLGDGYLLVNDWVQVGRYTAGLDPLTVAGGPTTEGPLAKAAGFKARRHPGSDTSLVNVGSTTLAEGEAGSVPVTLTSLGTENALGFSLAFDPTLVTYVGTSAGTDAAGATLLVNSSQAASGHLGYALALGTGNTFLTGARELIRVTFKASSTASGTVATAFADQPVPRAISDALADVVPASYSSGTIAVDPPPRLDIARSGQSLFLSWPLWATNFTLQEAQGTLPISGKWTNPPVTISITNNQRLVVLPVGATTKYYRLFHP
jgi:hypothetical protein